MNTDDPDLRPLPIASPPIIGWLDGYPESDGAHHELTAWLDKFSDDVIGVTDEDNFEVEIDDEIDRAIRDARFSEIGRF